MTATEVDAVTGAPVNHFLDPKSAGLGFLGRIGTIILFCVLVGSLTIMKLVGVIPGAVALAVGGAGLLFIARRDIHDRSGAERTSTRLAHNRDVRSGQSTYRSGPLTPLGTYRLPGILAQTTQTEGTTVSGEAFSLVETPSTNDFAVCWEAHPNGASLIDPADLERSIVKWGETLKFLCNRPGALQAMVTIETAPDTGEALQTRINGLVSPHSSPAGIELVKQLGDKAPAGAASVRSFVTVTFSGEYAGKKRNAVETAKALAADIPEIARKIHGSGAGYVTVVDAQSLTEVIRVAYDPGCGADVAKARHDGNPIVMRWDSIGPAAANKDWEYYRHASGASKTWSMTDIQGEIALETLAPFLQPDPAIDRKRVSFVYELRSPGKAAGVAGADENSAAFRASAQNASARAKKRHQVAGVNAVREARGDALLDVSIIVTATLMDRVVTDDKGDTVRVPAESRLPEAVAAIDNLGPQARLLLRSEDGCQAAAFAMNLPGIGVVPNHHVKVPVALRDAL